jgi:hypothetical protein
MLFSGSATGVNLLPSVSSISNVLAASQCGAFTSSFGLHAWRKTP